MAHTVAVYQPRYFPRLHYLARAAQADTFVLFDTVEFSRRSRQHRTEIDFGSKKWLTIPVRHAGNETLIQDAETDTSSRWPTKHAKTLRHKYGSEASLFDEIYPDFEEDESAPKLVDVTIPALRKLFSEYEIDSEVVRASELGVERSDAPSEYLAQLVDKLDGDRYLCGETGYRNYLRGTPFEQRGIDVIVQDWTPNWDGGNVNALDVLFNSENPRSHIESNGAPVPSEDVTESETRSTG